MIELTISEMEQVSGGGVKIGTTGSGDAAAAPMQFDPLGSEHPSGGKATPVIF